ncbi:hypothetical protein P3S68_002667 [Capsicum galapagoense]
MELFNPIFVVLNPSILGIAGKSDVYFVFLEMKHDLLHMEYTALMEPKGF